MKKLIVFIALVAMATTVFGQTTSELLKLRAQEIGSIEKRLKKSTARGVQIDQEKIDSMETRINNFYQPLILAAMERESPTTTPAAPTAPATTVIKKTTSYVDYDTTGRPDIVASASSETPVNLPPPVPTAPENRRAPRGGNISFQGDNGGYSGRGSIPAVADAYNSSRLNEAIATAIEASAQPAQVSSDGQTTAPTTSVPVEQAPVNYVGYIKNHSTLRGQTLFVTITGVDNPYFLQKEQAEPGQMITAYLPAGRYRIVTKLKWIEPAEVQEIFVGNPMARDIIGGVVYHWGINQEGR